MAGDYWRYLAEFASGDDRKAKADKAKDKYEAATRAAVDQGLPPTNPIRLGLALNYSACPEPERCSAAEGGSGTCTRLARRAALGGCLS